MDKSWRMTDALTSAMSAHRWRPPYVTKEAGWVCGSGLEAAVTWLSSGVPPGGRRRRLYGSRGSGGAGVGCAASSACRGLPVRGGYVPGPCQVVTAGRAEPAGVAGPAGQKKRVGGVSATAPIPAVRGQAFSCPWVPGSQGARTRHGRRQSGIGPRNAYVQVRAFVSGEKESGL
jgi:hypothetical protein